MNSQKIAQVLYENLIVGLEPQYRELYSNQQWKENEDKYSIAISGFYQSLSEEQKGHLFDIARQISVDQIATLFSILEGSSYSELDHVFVLKDHEGNLFENLSDAFLEVDENRNNT